jgi:histidinol-phosphate aminotransferase
MSLPSPRPGVQALEGYHSPQLDVPVRLNTNESPFAPPPAFVDAWLGALAAIDLNRYPDRAATDLRAGIAKHVGQPADRIFAANGSNEVLQTLLLAYGGPGRRALVFEPTYALHSHICHITGTDVVTGERGADFRISPTEVGILVGSERPSVVFVCSPNNPTGTVESRATLEAVLASVIDRGNALLVVDEAYGEFADSSAIDLVADDVPLVVVRTYSKVWSLAALRLGFCIAPPAVVAEFEKVVLPYHLSAATQTAGVAALAFRDEMDERVHTLVAERHRMAEALGRLPGVTAYPSGANFVLIRAAGDGHALWQALVDRGVLVRDFSRWPRLDECLRITVGTADENDRCLAALREVLTESGER